MRMACCKLTDKEWQELEMLVGEGNVSSILRKWIQIYLQKHSIPTETVSIPTENRVKDMSIPIKTEGIPSIGIPVKIAELRGIIKGIEDKPSIEQVNTPTYDPQKHKPGDTVKVKRGSRWLTITIPNLDAEGNSIPD